MVTGQNEFDWITMAEQISEEIQRRFAKSSSLAIQPTFTFHKRVYEILLDIFLSEISYAAGHM